MSSDSASANSCNRQISVLEVTRIPPKPTFKGKSELREDKERNQSEKDDHEDQNEDQDEDENEKEDKVKIKSPHKQPTVIKEPFPPPPSQYPPGVHSWRMNAELSVPWPDINMKKVEDYIEDTDDAGKEDNEVRSAHNEACQKSENTDEVQPGGESKSLSEDAHHHDYNNDHEAPTSSAQALSTISDGPKTQLSPTLSRSEEAAIDKHHILPSPLQHPPGVYRRRMNICPYVVQFKRHDFARPERLAARCAASYRGLCKRSVRARINSELDRRKVEPVLQVRKAAKSFSASTSTESQDKPGIPAVWAASGPAKTQRSPLPPAASGKKFSTLDVSPRDLSAKAQVLGGLIKMDNENAQSHISPSLLTSNLGGGLKNSSPGVVGLILFLTSGGHLDREDSFQRGGSINGGYRIQTRVAETGPEIVYAAFHNNDIVDPVVNLSWPCARTRYNGVPNKGLLSEVEANMPFSAPRSLLPFNHQSNARPPTKEKRKLETMNAGDEGTEYETITKKIGMVPRFSACGNSFHDPVIIGDDTTDILIEPIRIARTSSNPVVQKTKGGSVLVSPSQQPLVVSPGQSIDRLQQRLRRRGIFNRTTSGRVHKVSSQPPMQCNRAPTRDGVNNRAGSNRVPAAPPPSEYILLGSPGADSITTREVNTIPTERPKQIRQVTRHGS
ncbi:hypothetical protein DFP73DRAFT_592154 [Morchella snyderi]|nr:hypothetical protein DFP73DRAFT_592154 [Morchella snyderi]